MKTSLACVLCTAVLPTAALAETGGKDSYAAQFIELDYAMKHDGRLEKAIAEGRANKAAFEALKQRELEQQKLQPPTAAGSVRRPRR